MPSKRSSRLGAALLSALVTVAAYGCAGTPQARNPGSPTNNAGFTARGSAVAGPEGMAGNDGAAGATGDGGNPGYRGANTGVGLWGASGARRVRRTTVNARMATDLGRQISAAVASMDGIGGTNRAGFMGMGTTGVNGAGARSVGVSTLVLDDIAFVGISQSTGQATTGSTAAGTAGTRAGLTRNRTGLGGNWNGIGGIGMTPGIEDGTVGLRRAGVTGAGTGTTGAAGTGTAGTPGTTAGTTRTPGTTAGSTPGTTVGTGTAGTTVGGTQRAATNGSALFDQVRARVKAMFPQVEEVYVTTDPDLVHRIARVTGDDHGMTVQEKVNEMTAIARAMTPLTPGAGSTGAGQAGGS